jgi:hypothetical protein
MYTISARHDTATSHRFAAVEYCISMTMWSQSKPSIGLASWLVLVFQEAWISNAIHPLEIGRGGCALIRK